VAASYLARLTAGRFDVKSLNALQALGFLKKQKAPHLLVNGVQW
jgi:hypothetical protein